MVAPDYVGSATHQLFENYLSGKTAVLKEESEIPREYWTEPIKALNPASIYQQHGNVVIVLRIQDGAEQGWYVPTSPSFCEPYLGIRMEDGFTFTDHDRGHGCEFSRTRSQEKKKQPAIADSFSHDHINAAIQAYWNYSLTLRKGDERLQEGSPPLFEIPSKYWPDAIKALQPVKVYEHYLNVAIVLRIRDGVEEGKYIGNPISSYMPHWGKQTEDGFSFAANFGSTVCDFRRTVGQ
jgi:hypothetical protein